MVHFRIVFPPIPRPLPPVVTGSGRVRLFLTGHSEGRGEDLCVHVNAAQVHDSKFLPRSDRHAVSIRNRRGACWGRDIGWGAKTAPSPHSLSHKLKHCCGRRQLPPRRRRGLGRRLLPLLLLLLVFITPVYAQQSSPVDDILSRLTLEQKVGQMFIVGLYGPTMNEPARDFLITMQPGGVVLFTSNTGTPDAVTRLTNSWQQTITGAGGVPLFIATDQEGGIIARLKEGFTEWPVPMVLTASGDVSLAYRTGQAMATELRAVGVNMDLAPVADLYTNLRNPIIGRRSFGSDPERTGKMLAALIRGMQAGGVLATAKHFPGHGDTDRDSHTSLPAVQYPRDELERVEFAPFRWTIAAGVESVMVAHIWYPAIDTEEIPASLSGNVVTGILRDEMDFRGLTMTDAIEMDAIDTEYSYSQASIMAINAGIDLVAFGAHVSPTSQATAMQAVIDAVKNGTIPQERIDASVRRILDAKARYGILDWMPLSPEDAGVRLRAPEHALLVEEIFEAGVTVAYDENTLLPISPDRNVLIIYPGIRPAIKFACEPLHNAANVRWSSVTESPSDGEIAGAARAAEWGDTVIVFTQNADRDLQQQALVNALPKEKTVAVALFSPYDWQSFPDVSAYVTTYSPLEPSIPAVCKLLFGAIPSRGQLPVALDGQRDFASFAATQGIVINVEGLAALPGRLTVTPLPTLTALPPTDPITETALPTFTASPVLSPTISPTHEPLESSTRAAVTPPSGAPTQIAAVSTQSSPDAVAPASIIPPSSDFNVPSWIWLAGGGLLIVGTAYGALYNAGMQAVNRYRRGFVVQKCPVCKQGHLHVETAVKHRVGIPGVSRRMVRCDHCRSLLREVGTRRWRYRINPRANSPLFDRLNNKVLDESTLKRL
jgi:beta-N-acetylhexosaminidase